MSKSIPSEISPAIRRGSRFTAKRACLRRAPAGPRARPRFRRDDRVAPPKSTVRRATSSLRPSGCRPDVDLVRRSLEIGLDRCGVHPHSIGDRGFQGARRRPALLSSRDGTEEADLRARVWMPGASLIAADLLQIAIPVPTPFLPGTPPRHWSDAHDLAVAGADDVPAHWHWGLPSVAGGQVIGPRSRADLDCRGVLRDARLGPRMAREGAIGRRSWRRVLPGPK
jgi:hypothetical protein